VPHPEYLITLVGPGSGAGDGVPGAAVRAAASGRIVDLLPGRNDVYSAVTGTGNNRLFYLAARSGRATDWHATRPHLRYGRIVTSTRKTRTRSPSPSGPRPESPW
jgi:hypothetical protein